MLARNALGWWVAFPSRKTGSRFMPCSRLALVTEDRSFADSIQAHLRKHLGQPAFQCAFETIREHLARNTDGLVVIAVGSPADCKAACWLVQDICLQKLPPVLLLLQND